MRCSLVSHKASDATIILDIIPDAVFTPDKPRETSVTPGVEHHSSDAAVTPTRSIRCSSHLGYRESNSELTLVRAPFQQSHWTDLHTGHKMSDEPAAVGHASSDAAAIPSLASGAAAMFPRQ